MTNQQIISQFKNAGFEAIEFKGQVLISLKNHRVTSMEVQYVNDTLTTVYHPFGTLVSAKS